MNKKKDCLFIAVLLLLGLRVFSQNPETDFNRADSLIDARQYEAGIRILDQLMVTDGEKEKYLTTRAYAWLNMQQKTKAKVDYNRALLLNPSCAKCYINLGIMATDDGDYNLAIVDFDKGIALEPGRAMGYIKRGELYYQTGFPEKALADFEMAQTIDPNEPYIFLWRAMTKLQLGMNEGALKDINRSIELKPAVEYAYFVRGKCHIRLGQFDSAWNDLSGCLKKNPAFNEYHNYAGIALFNLRDYNQALQAFNESVRLDSTHYLPYLYRSYISYDNGKFSVACRDKEKALQLLQENSYEAAMLKQVLTELDTYCNTDRASFYKHTGDILFKLGYYDRAAFSFEQGLKKFNTNPVLAEGRGNAAIAMGKFKEALGYYKQCLQQSRYIDTLLIISNFNPDGKTATAFFMAQLYNSIAYAQINLMQPDSSIAAIGNAIKLLEQNPAIHDQPTVLATYLAKRGSFHTLLPNYKEAGIDFSAAIRIAPQLPDVYLERAGMLANKNSLLPGGIKDAVPASEAGNKKNLIYPTTPTPAASKEELRQALEDCSKAIALNPTLGRAFLLRARITILLKGDPCGDIKKAEILGVSNAAKSLEFECN